VLDKIKRLGTDTAVYGVSTVLGRFLTFFLTPFYTHILRPEDMGIVATMYAYIAFLNVVYGYGMESAFMKYVSTLEVGDRKQNFSVPFLSVTVTAALFSGAGFLWSHPLAGLADLPTRYDNLIGYSALILFLDAVAIIPFAHLRMVRKARTFAAIKMANIVITVVCNLVFLLHYGMGVEGIFLSGVIASASTLVLLLPTVAAHLTLHWSRPLYRALLRFGLPYVPAGLATMMIQVINRPILDALCGLAAVGVFQANYRLGIFMMLVVSMVDFAWRPFFFSHAQEPDARPLFARVMTYMVLCTSGIFLTLSLFVGDLVRAPLFLGRPLVAPAYWSGLDIVPTVLLGYLFLGIYNNLLAGIYIEKRTSLLPPITIAGAVVNVAANYALIPLIGLQGAALATLMSYVAMAGVLYAVVRRIYPVPYEWGRLAKIAGATAFVFLLSLAVPTDPSAILWKSGLLVLFGVSMIVMKFFVPSELRALSRLVRRRGPARSSPPLPEDDHGEQ
jgi:O-antigen/teichoic acid export membrane protein